MTYAIHVGPTPERSVQDTRPDPALWARRPPEGVPWPPFKSSTLDVCSRSAYATRTRCMEGHPDDAMTHPSITRALEDRLGASRGPLGSAVRPQPPQSAGDRRPAHAVRPPARASPAAARRRSILSRASEPHGSHERTSVCLAVKGLHQMPRARHGTPTLEHDHGKGHR
jgi:hypothetical protein